MSFLVSPPEIISSLLYSGAGSGPMLAAAAAWDGLSAELGSAAQSFASITTGLSGGAWQGAASTAMLSTAAQYTNVLSAASAQAQSASAQATSVASAFESAVAATVHPLVVSANRNQLVQLVVSNLFGQNAPAIAATESQYEQMWAADVSAMVGYHGGASAAASNLTTWSSAMQSLPAEASAVISGSPVASAASAVSAAVSGSPAAGVIQSVEGVFGGLGSEVQQAATVLINAPTNILFGKPLIGTGSITGLGSAASTGASLGGVANGSSATVPINMVGGTEATVNASVGSGGAIPLLVDTGSTGLVVPYQDVGGILGLLQAGFPRGLGIGGYSGGLDYIFATYNMPVNFGGGVSTAATPVNVELFAFPTSIQSAMQNGFSFQSYFAPDGVAGVLGLGPNAGGPGPSIPTEAFGNSAWNQGVLVNESVANPYLQFGANPFAATATLTGAPITNLQVAVNGGAHQVVGSIVDSGGVEGTLPSSLGAVTGDTVDVYSSTGQFLYNFVDNNNYFPETISSGLMNTGALPFLNNPIYINNAADTLSFDA